MRTTRTRRAVTALIRLVIRLFFRRIEIAGQDRVPATGPVMFVLNHPNGLVDPPFILCFAPRPVVFLAKAPLFRMLFLGFLARAFDSLPVERRQDEGADPAKNREMFAKARALLAGGGAIAIFPEGVSHSDPKLRPLKPGAARIALGAGLADLAIIPAGLYYTAKKTFRSAALLRYGEPIRVDPVPLGPDGEPPREAVQALSARIEAALREVTLNAEHDEALAAIARAERVYSSVERARTLAAELELRRRFLEGYAFWKARAPERIDALDRRIARYEAELAEAGLDPETLAPGGFRARRVLRHVAARIPLLVLLLPAALAGALVHWPAYRLAGAIAMRIAKDDDDMVSTAKALGGMLFFPLTWIALALALGAAWRPAAGLAALAAAPALGYAALRVFEEIDALRGGARALVYFVTKRRFFEALERERAAIRAEIEALGHIGPEPRERDG